MPRQVRLPDPKTVRRALTAEEIARYVPAEVTAAEAEAIERQWERDTSPAGKALLLARATLQGA